VRSRAASLIDGILIIDKPQGITSHDVVKVVRKRLNTSRVGHLGTLDPMATGVLPVAVGKATRISQFIPHSPKEYEGEIRFGFATNTYDREGVATSEEKPLEGDVAVAMQAFKGLLDQVPPPFSAKKIGGIPAYDLARKNKSIDMAPVRVEIREFDLLKLEPPFMRFRVVCSPGTYIRSLAHDLGQRLGCGAHLTALRRTRSGNFQIESSVDLEQISADAVIVLDQLMDFMPKIQVTGADETRVVHGNSILLPAGGEHLAPLARIFNKEGLFIAIAAVERGWVHPRLVLTSIDSRHSDMLGCTLEKEANRT
jgi:tRNA pseudouridine55 synthase